MSAIVALFAGLRLSPVRLSGTRVLLGSWLGSRPSRRVLTSTPAARGVISLAAPCFLTRAQRAELRRKLAEVEAKLRQLAAVECGRGRWPSDHQGRSITPLLTSGF